MQQNKDIIIDDENVIVDDDIVKDEPQQNNNNKQEQNNLNQEQKKQNKKNNIENIKIKLKDLKEKHPKAIKIVGGSFVASVLLLGGLYFYVSSSVGEIPDYKTDFNNQQQFKQIPKKKEYNRLQKQHIKTTTKVNKKIEHKNHSKKNISESIKIKQPIAISAPIIQNNKKELNIENIKKKTINKKDPIVQHIASNITNIPQKLNDKNLLTLNSEKLIENKNYEKYLQSKIQLMQKLSIYYKKTAELKKTLDLYKQVLETKQQSQPKKQENQMSSQLKNTLSSLHQEIISLREEVAKNKEKSSPSEINIVTNSKSLGINSMNVYQKDGRYIVVAKTSSGDKILRVGDIYNNSKIIGITPTTITFQKGEQRYYYNTTPSFSNNYQTANIKLANTISTTNLKNNTINNKKSEVAKYKQETPEDRLQMLLQQRNK